MRVLCVARHPFLSEHLGRFFERLGIETIPCVGVREAMDLVAVHNADAVICDYDLLAAFPIEQWCEPAMLGDAPIVAVSLTRRPTEVHLLDINGIAGFLYLPTLDRETLLRVIGAASRPRHVLYSPMTWARQQPTVGG